MLKKILYKELNARQKENYNFHKLSSVLADYGYHSLRLSDDWNGADFIAVHISGTNSLNVQLKARFTFSKKYIGKNIWIAFPYRKQWYLYPHDELLKELQKTKNFHTTPSWRIGSYTWGRPDKIILKLLEEYLLSN